MNDDELRSRMSGLADQTELDTVTLEQVQARSRRRTLQRRGVSVLAAFALVVGGAVGIAALGGPNDGGDVDIAAEDGDADATESTEGDDGSPEAEADGEPTAEESEASIDTDDAITTTTVGPETLAVDAADIAFSEPGFYGGPSQVVPWGDGFLAFGERYIETEPAELSFDGEDPISAYFPQEILDVLAESGVTTLDEAQVVLADADLLDLATQIVTENPEVMEWFTMSSGGGFSEPFVEFSTDGVTWEPLEDFAWPNGQTWAPQMGSNGEQLVAVVTDTTWDEATGRPVDPSISVFITDDLSTWTEVPIPVDVPEVADYVQLDVHANQLVVTDDEWYVTVGTWQWIDLWSALPQSVLDEMAENGFDWQPTEAGVEIVDWNWDAYEEGEIEGEWEEPEPTVIRTIPWSELPFSYDEWTNTQYDTSSSQAFVGGFDGGVAVADVPGGQMDVRLTPAGDRIFALVFAYPEFDESEPSPGFIEEAYQPSVNAYVSDDGRAWQSVTLPALGDNAWFDGVAPVQDGVLLVATGDFEGQRFFVGDRNGEGFVEVDGPDLPDNTHVWFSAHNASGDGIATVIDLGQPTYPEFIAYEVTFSHDGFTITTGQDGAGGVSLTVTDEASGEIVYAFDGEVYAEPPFIYAESGIIINDDDGELIVEIPFEIAEEEIFRAESAAWDAAYSADPYVPDFRLIATRDGRTWTVQPLPPLNDEYGWYGEPIVIGDQVLLADGTGGWSVIDLP